jgi:hypothetical protein
MLRRCEKIGELRKQIVIRKDGWVEEDFERNLSQFSCHGITLLKHMTSHPTEGHPYHQNEPHSKASETQPSLKGRAGRSFFSQLLTDKEPKERPI